MKSVVLYSSDCVYDSRMNTVDELKQRLVDVCSLQQNFTDEANNE